ncbi:MAG TPA: heparinase II/III family protein, partial [Alphaproteobacteria bacterium]|nr:heparinase II/III family protein [Alphaproteobacteria bacterium]
MGSATKIIKRVKRGVQTAAYGNPIYRRILETGEMPVALRFAPPDPWPGDAEAGRAMLADQRSLFGDPALPRGTAAILRCLRAVGTDAARQLALRVIGAWLTDYDDWHESEWAPAILGERLAGWVGFYEFYAPAAPPEFIAALAASLARQWKHLARTLPPTLTGAEGLEAIKGLILGSLNFPDGDRALSLACDLLARQLRAEICNDGGHVARNPSAHLSVLRHLVDIRDVLREAAIEAPGELPAAIAALVPALRFYRHGDGGLALFHGGTEETPVMIEAILGRAGVRNRALRRLPETGYERLTAGRSLLIADCGPPPPRDYSDTAHAGLMSFEFGQGRERLIVNCGALGRPDAGWRRALGATAAHSTLTVADTNICEILPSGRIESAVRVTAQRYEQDGAHCVEMMHDGYRHRFGVLHHRTLILTADGDEVRGRDALALAPGAKDCDFTVRWHVHPDVQVSLVHSGRAALLRTPSGTGWRLRIEGGDLGIETSVYCGAGIPRRSLQLKVGGRTNGSESAVIWSLA